MRIASEPSALASASACPSNAKSPSGIAHQVIDTCSELWFREINGILGCGEQYLPLLGPAHSSGSISPVQSTSLTPLSRSGLWLAVITMPVARPGGTVAVPNGAKVPSECEQNQREVPVVCEVDDAGPGPGQGPGSMMAERIAASTVVGLVALLYQMGAIVRS